MPKYEYKVEIQKIGILTDNNKKQEAQLNALGAQGWKFVSQIESKKYLKYIFVREIS